MLRSEQTNYYNYRVYPGYMGPNKKGRDVYIEWKCNTLIGHQLFTNPDAKVIDTFPEE
jgi:hypothetical protein